MTTRKLFAALFTILFGLIAAAPAAQATGNLKAIGLTQDGMLVRFNTGSPGNTKDIGFITGLQSPDTSLIGIDFRVQDGLLYGVGDVGGLYTINTQNAVATPVPAPIGPALDVDLDGTFFGVDFNPAANALRIVSDTGQNLRHPFGAGATQGVTQDDSATFGPLLYGVPVSLPATGVTAAAYTNNDDAIAVPNAASTGTTLFDIDPATVPPATDPQDVVVIQSPANNGLLVSTGSLGVDADQDAGFDIFSKLGAGVAVSNAAFASLFVNGRYRLYTINLLTGKATAVGAFDDQVVDIALSLN
ncbi:MAG: DUF4394 domain-containing protein [Gammaproteobacteria bacterium]